jgi:hypothetical protein
MGKTVAGRAIERKRAACLRETILLQPRAQAMFGAKRNKEAERFYLLPGQGGQAYRRKQKFILKWAVAVGMLVAGMLGALMYWLNRAQF